MSDFLSVLYSQPVSVEFVQQFVARARNEHQLEGDDSNWDYIEHRLREWTSNSPSWRLLAALHYMFLSERNMQQRFVQTLSEERRQFYETQWKPYLVKQTRRMKEAVHEDPNAALRLYSDSLREAWQWQRVEHSDLDGGQEEPLIKDISLQLGEFTDEEVE
jgi:hypothetical protein